VEQEDDEREAGGCNRQRSKVEHAFDVTPVGLRAA
jgi:hypothetical protein